VLLLGGPNTYLPFLRDCWRKRIPETWRDRGYAYPKDVPIEELIIVPENAQYYAAYGAVMYGLYENAEVGVYKGMAGLKDFILNGRAARLGDTAGPPLLTLGDDNGRGGDNGGGHGGGGGGGDNSGHGGGGDDNSGHGGGGDSGHGGGGD